MLLLPMKIPPPSVLVSMVSSHYMIVTTALLTSVRMRKVLCPSR